MNNKLPKVFVNKIDKVLNVNQDYTRSTSSINLETILDDKNKYLKDKFIAIKKSVEV